jgi:hypothetical protein
MQIYSETLSESSVAVQWASGIKEKAVQSDELGLAPQMNWGLPLRRFSTGACPRLQKDNVIVCASNITLTLAGATI